MATSETTSPHSTLKADLTASLQQILQFARDVSVRQLEVCEETAEDGQPYVAVVRQDGTCLCHVSRTERGRWTMASEIIENREAKTLEELLRL